MIELPEAFTLAGQLGFADDLIYVRRIHFNRMKKRTNFQVLRQLLRYRESPP